MHTERPKHYNTTADAMNKAQSTAYRHAARNKNQDLLDGFGFSNSRPATSTLPVTSKKLPPALKTAMLLAQSAEKANQVPAELSDTGSDVQVVSAPPSQPPSPIILDDSAPPSPRVPAIRHASRSPEGSEEQFPSTSEHVSSAAVSDNDDFPPMSEPVSSAAASDAGNDLAGEQVSTQDEAEEELGEAWEDELEDNLASTTGPIRGWDEIRKEIKAELKKNSKILPLSRVNQLMIICNFATLRLKGVSRIQAGAEIARQWHEGKGDWFARRVRSLARHYQLFGRLPPERRGGARLVQSWLHDERVKIRVLEYLRNVPAGKVTPRALQNHINSSLFPELEITPKTPLTIRTAQRWLIKLGWTHTIVKKGVYMDGHERLDVVHYRNEEFLPAMLKFEERMVHYEGPELTRVEPKLKPGEEEIIPLFHDECCFHGNDEKNHAWYYSDVSFLAKRKMLTYFAGSI
jgi:hypothetical protein